MKKIIWGILILSLFLAASLASAEIVYQENADSTLCDGAWFDSWGYPCSNTIDGDWSSYGMADGSNYCWALINMNYNKLGTGATWQVKDGLAEINLTIPASCFDYDTNTLILRAWSYSNEGLEWEAGWECYDGSWQILRDTTLASAWDNGKIYEEGVYWETGAADCTSDAECDDTDACTTDICDLGTGECAHTALSCDDGNACTQDSCDALLGCQYAPINAYCGFCMKCSAGVCVNQNLGQDLKKECNPSNVCLNDWTIKKTLGSCDGSGACRAQLVTVSIGNVCYNGQNVNPNANANCGLWNNCVAGKTSAAQFWVGYNLGPTCTDTGWIASGGQWSAAPHNMISVTEHAPLVCQETYRQCIVNSDCGFCQKCVNSQCVNQNSGQDLKDECNPSSVCLNDWTIHRTLGTCDGSGACRTQTVNVGAGNVCINGQNVNPNANVHCGELLYNCIEGRRIAYQFYLGYAGDGTPTCTSTGWVRTGASFTAPRGYVISPTQQAVSCSIRPV